MTTDLNISLSHINEHLDLNNANDVGNIDRVLTLIVQNKEDITKLRSILQHTTLKYLQRLHEDGLVTDKGGPKQVPVSNPIVTEKAIKFLQMGGCSSLIQKPASSFNYNHSETIIGNKIENSTIHDFKGRNNSNISQQGEEGGGFVKILVKWWWAFIVPLLLAILGLAIEYKWFN